MVDIALTYTRGVSTYWPISNTVKAIGIGGPASSLLLPTKMIAFLAAGRRGGRTQLSTGGRDVVIPTKCLYSNTWLKDEKANQCLHGSWWWDTWCLRGRWWDTWCLRGSMLRWNHLVHMSRLFSHVVTHVHFLSQPDTVLDNAPSGFLTRYTLDN